MSPAQNSTAPRRPRYHPSRIFRSIPPPSGADAPRSAGRPAPAAPRRRDFPDQRAGSPIGLARESSGVHPTVFEIELAFERAQHVVVDRALGAKPQERLALGVDDRPPDLPVLDELAIFPVARGIALAFDVFRAVPIG